MNDPPAPRDPLMPFRSFFNQSKAPDGGPARPKRRSLLKALKKTMDRFYFKEAEQTPEIPTPPAEETPVPPDDEQARAKLRRATTDGVPQKKPKSRRKHSSWAGRPRWSSSRRVSSATPVQTSSEVEEDGPVTPSTPPPSTPPVEVKPEPRILSEKDLETLFAGAPHFSLPRDEAGEPVTRVTFPFDRVEEQRELQNLSDSQDWGHPTFSLATSRNPGSLALVDEVPSMRSFLGREPGTCGWEYFLTLPIGDAERANAAADGEDEVDEGGRERGRRSSGGKGPVRSVEAGYIVDRLKEVGDIWWSRRMRSRTESEDIPVDESEELSDMPSGLEMYTHLFTHLLYPPARITTVDFQDPYSLKVQILELINALSRNVWLDFGNVGWRIKLGQILWGNPGEADDPPRETEKVWLLLQTLLACELVLRLDIVLNDEQSTAQSTETKDEMLQRFREAGNWKVEWDIVLARRWLDNVKIIEIALPKRAETPEQKPSSFLAPRWFGGGAASTPPEPSPDPSESSNPISAYDALLVPRHRARQLEGLLHFATSLRWPNTDMISHNLLTKLRTQQADRSGVSSSVGTPLSVNSASSSYFPPRPRRLHSGPEVYRKRSELLLPQLDHADSSFVGTGGWLSQSYLTGLILPGEGLPHLLISTLLENDAIAVERLGYNANLYGGFQYEGYTWWSMHCVVGRVLAGLEGARQCAGWVGACPAPTGKHAIEDGWVDVPTLPLPEQPRALQPKLIASNSDPRGRGWRKEQDLTGEDFVSLQLLPESAPTRVELKDMVFTPSATDQEDEFRSYEVCIRFCLPRKEEDVCYWLKYDVAFISAWPCRVSQSSGEHPLHKSFVYKAVVVDQLGEKMEEGVVAVVRAADEVEVACVKAWCAQMGVCAVVARRGVTCAGCAVREACAVGAGVVVFVED